MTISWRLSIIKPERKNELPKMPVKMNEFTGTEKDKNVQTWVDQLNTIKVVHGWDDESIIKQEWYFTSGKDVVGTCKEFFEALVKRFTMNSSCSTSSVQTTTTTSTTDGKLTSSPSYHHQSRSSILMNKH